MKLEEALPEMEIAIKKIEINVLKDLESTLIAMNEIDPLEFGSVRSLFAEYISGREYEIKELKTK